MLLVVVNAVVLIVVVVVDTVVGGGDGRGRGLSEALLWFICLFGATNYRTLICNLSSWCCSTFCRYLW